MCESCTASAFGTVGENVFSFVGSGKPPANSKYGKSVQKNTMGTGSSPTGTTGMPKNIKLPETGGPTFTVTDVLYKANAAAAQDTSRNVKLMKSAAGVTDSFTGGRNS